MNITMIKWSSLKTRITLVSLVIFVVSIWSLLFYFIQILQSGWQQQFGEQQLTIASVMTENINQELDLRLRTLEKTAEKITPAIMSNTSKLQKLLDEPDILQLLFNGGYFAIQADGMTLADFPVSTGRIGMNVSEKGWMIEALKGKPAIGKPVIGKMLHVPVFTMATPIRDSAGTVIGVLAGVVDLSKPNFLDKITDNRPGKAGGYLLIAPQHKLIVTATDKKRIMSPMPVPGGNPLFDRYNQGFEGFGRSVNTLGVEELTASKKIPVAGWFLIVKTPISEAFAPFYHTQQHMIVATFFITFLVGCVIWRVLKHQLSPIFNTVSMLSLMSDGSQRTDLLPVARQDEIGQLVGAFNSLLKTLEQRKEELRSSLENLEESQRIAHVGSWRLDIATNQVTWSEELYRMYGFDPKSPPPLYTEHQNLFTPDSWSRLTEALQNTRNTGIPYDLELEILRADGSIGKMWVYGMSVLDANGVTVGLRGMAQDITERKYAEDQLRNAKEFLELTQRSAGAGLWAWDFVSGELSWSQEQYQMYGLDPAVGPPTFDLWRSVVHPDDLKVAESNIRDAIHEHVQLFNEYRIIKRSGEVRWIQAIGRINYDNTGEPRRMSGICLDITGRKKAEEDKQLFEHQLQHTQKLESLGILAGGIAHDFNNILAIIMGYCSLTNMDYENSRNNITEIEKAAERAAGLCRQMLAYAGKARLTMAQINMGMLLDEMVAMLKVTLPQHAEITLDVSTGIPPINGDSSQIRQVIMNLIINASEAIGKEHGEIRVSLATVTIKAGQSDEDYNGKSIPPGDYVCLDVTDNGCGMDEETKWRIFEPFYTTKFTGRGLGMSAVLGIIKSHAGTLQLYSQPGSGTTFKVYLPVLKNDSTEDENLKQSGSSAPWRGNGTVLLVEDEDQVRRIAKALLKNIGFTVLEAANGKEALELYQKNATDITLVLTDMGMPVMDGYELFYELKKLNSGLPIIVSSGYGDAEVSSRLSKDDIAGLISKPYGPDQLREALKRVVG